MRRRLTPQRGTVGVGRRRERGPRRILPRPGRVRHCSSDIRRRGDAIAHRRERQRTEREAAAEWKGIRAWAVGQANAADLNEVRARTDKKMPDHVERVDHIGDHRNGDRFHPGQHRAARTPRRAAVRRAPRGWLLGGPRIPDHIHNAALARMCSPWALLANCTARALALVRPHATLPPLIGGPGSLNWFAAIAAPSGGGKGAAGQLSPLLVPSRVESATSAAARA